MPIAAIAPEQLNQTGDTICLDVFHGRERFFTVTFKPA